jgi:hypothetical protein
VAATLASGIATDARMMIIEETITSSTNVYPRSSRASDLMAAR